jgi:hypothetical protein
MSVPTEIRGSLGEIGDANLSEARALSQHKTMPPTAGNTVELQGSFRVADVYFAADDTTFWSAKIGGGRHGMAPKWSVDGFHRRVGLPEELPAGGVKGWNRKRCGVCLWRRSPHGPTENVRSSLLGRSWSGQRRSKASGRDIMSRRSGSVSFGFALHRRGLSFESPF